MKPTNAVMLKLYLIQAVCHKSGMFRSVLVILRELLNINKAYIKT